MYGNNLGIRLSYREIFFVKVITPCLPFLHLHNIYLYRILYLVFKHMKLVTEKSINIFCDWLSSRILRSFFCD